MRTCAIVNPVAGRGRVRRLWPELRDGLHAALPSLTVRRTTRPKQATTFTRAALADGYDQIVAVGGDGTLHEVVNGYFESDGSPIPSTIPLVPIPCGTGTDFNRTLRGRTGLDALSYIDSDQTRRIDLMRVRYTRPNGDTRTKYAVNVASFGVSGRVVQRLARGGGLVPGTTLRYLEAIIPVLLRYRAQGVTVSVDGQKRARSHLLLGTIANGHSFAGGIKIAPEATTDDGRLNVTLVDDLSLLRVLQAVPRAYQGTHLSLDGVTSLRGQRVTARPVDDDPVWLEADGELLGRLPVSVEVVPQALPLRF